MICNRCGTENEDDQRFCQKCGHKLQSAFRGEGGPGAGPGASERQIFDFEAFLERRSWFGRYLEAWFYVGLLGGATVYGLVTRVFWPLYVAIPLVGLLAWLRRP